MLARGLGVVALLALCSALPARAQIDARMFRYPDVSETHIAFVYAGDIWMVEKGGGIAHKLSSPSGEEMFPRFSPGGTELAFTGNYDGNYDVYTIPATGGEPRRLTYHPSWDRLIDWTPAGDELLFSSSRETGNFRTRKIYRVAASGGFPEGLPIPYGEYGAMSPDGSKLAYTPESRSFRTWKRYRGGAAPEIWLFDLATLDAENLSESAANDALPMWHGETIYFLSDRGSHQRNNIWRLDLTSKEMRQITNFTDVDITFPSIGPSDIVFQAGGRLYLVDLASEETSEVEVDVVTDQATLKPRTVNVGRRITNAGISPTGKRGVFEARGEIFTVPAEHGPVRNLTQTSGAAERFPAWSPDGRYVAYSTDGGGEFEIAIRPADGSGEERIITNFGNGFRYRPIWSPESEEILFISNDLKLHFYDIDDEELVLVDELPAGLHGGLQYFEASWSADDRWIAYSKTLESGNEAIFLFDTEEEKLHQVTSGYYHDTGPVFDPDGKYLYYRSNRTLEPIYSDMDATWVYPNTTNIVAIGLRDDVPSPLAARNDEEEIEEDEEEEGEDSDDENGEAEEDADEEGDDDGDDDDGEDDDEEDLVIDLEGFELRGVILPPDAGNYGRLRAVSGKLIYHRMPRSGSGDEARPVVFYDLEEREEKTILGDAGFFEISADDKKMLVENHGSWTIVDIAPDQKMEKTLATSGLEMELDPKAEWTQMFDEVWRTYRDYFYDPEMHGLDWNRLRDHYRDMLDNAVTRWDVNFVIGELIGEVNASHTYVAGGDTETPAFRQTGLLGIDWGLENGVYRIERIIRGAPWDIQTRSPLAEPGLEVKEGDYVLAVNRMPLDAATSPYAALAGLAGKTVQLTVNEQPTAEGAHDIFVQALGDEYRLRNLDWIEKNRQYVLEASDGRIGYIYVPNTGIFGQTELVRQFNYQHKLDGLIIDERWNGGGQLPDRFVELMNRQAVGVIYFRYGRSLRWPQITHEGHKAMIINGQAGSGGDAFPWFFREMNAGVLVGERTWGGLIGPAVGHRLVDGGFYTSPPGRLYTVEGDWFAEGHGVDPDIAVVDHPSVLARGKDPQLDAAIAELTRRIQEDPLYEAPPPAPERRVAGSAED